MVTAAKAFLEGGFTEIGTGTLNEALALRRSGVSAPVHLCYQPDIQSAPAVAHAPDVQAGHWCSGYLPVCKCPVLVAALPDEHRRCSDMSREQWQRWQRSKCICLRQPHQVHTSMRKPVVPF